MLSEDPAVDSVGLLWPDQDGAGAHVNVTGAGLAVNAPHREEAVAFLEFLVSDEAQRILAEGATEFPVSEDAMADSAILERLGDFEAEPVNVSVFGENQAEAARIFDQVGWP
jgi:iron(III) transport system substrate-binding protein